MNFDALISHFVLFCFFLSQYVLRNAKSFFHFLLEMGDSITKKLFQIARCFGSHLVSLFESFQKGTERSRIMVIIQNRIILKQFWHAGYNNNIR